LSDVRMTTALFKHMSNRDFPGGMPLRSETVPPGNGTKHDAYSARIRLFFGLCSTSARCKASRTGGTYMPNRPRSPLFRPYHPPLGVFKSHGCSRVPASPDFPFVAMCNPSTGETERRLSRLYFNGSPPSGGGFHGEKSAFREKLREPASLRKVGPVGAHLLDRILRVPPLHLDAPNRIAQDADR